MRAFSYTRVHFRSRNNDGRSMRRTRKLHAACKHHGSMFDRTGVIADRSFNCGDRNFRHFGSCDLDLDPMAFTYELDL